MAMTRREWWLCCTESIRENGYDGSPYEVEAYKKMREIQADLKQVGDTLFCGCQK
jgi:hypothetical protein